MAIIKDKSTEFELFPRKYEEDIEDPFIFTIFRITINNKPIINLYSPLLLKSEYDEIIYKLDLLLSNRTKKFILETVEQLFTLKIIQGKNDSYKFNIIFKQNEIYNISVQTTRNSLQQFYNDLKENLSNVQSSPYLP
ncbi:WapI family immunity protein [Virgibacillus proomii]|uniref:WapI family immunity protein n=1 Tax=Virgibacillus proomii TaxID=84407 RepID=UPI0040397E9C